MLTPILKVENLSVRFFLEEEKRLLPALCRVSFHINENEVLGIIGESGSGKSVTLLSILGLLQGNPGIIEGKITFNTNGNEINTLQDISEYVTINNCETNDEVIRKNIHSWNKLTTKRYSKILGKVVSMIFQNPRLAFNPYYSIGKQIRESVLLHTKENNKNTAKETAIDWLTRVKMEAPALRYNNNPYGLSGGLCQRAMIAMALASEPQLLIADEPTTGLDATIQDEILSLLEELKKRHKLSMIIVSHDFNVMHRLANRVLVYFNGFIIEEGNTDVILDHKSDTHHPYTSLLLNTEYDDIRKKNDFSENTQDQQFENQNSSLNTINVEPKASFYNQCPYYKDCDRITSDIKDSCATSIPPLVSIHNNHKIRCWKFA